MPVRHLTNIKKIIASAILLCIVNGSQAQQSGGLDITPEFQQTPEWCWVTSSSMIFRYYEIPCVNPAGNYQCGLIGWYFGPGSPCYYNCYSCPVPARSLLDVRNMFILYPQAAGMAVYGTPMHLQFAISGVHISRSLVKASIDNGSPVLTGISPSGFFRGISEHVAVIKGYEEDEQGVLTLIVNDPFPYDLPAFQNMPNPYLRAGGTDNGDGSYNIGFNQYVAILQWHETMYNFQKY